MAPRRVKLEAPPGLTPEAQSQWSAQQRAFDQVHADVSSLAAGDVAYTPGDSSKWASPAPTTTQQALDRMASLLYTLNTSTAIP